MSKPVVELEHSQAAGAEAVMVMFALLLAILISAAAFAMTMARNLERQAAHVAQAAALETGPLASDARWEGEAAWLKRGR